MKINVKGGGPVWTALVRKQDLQVMVAFAGCNPPAFGMVRAFLRAVGGAIPRNELLVCELDAELRIKVAKDIETRFKIADRADTTDVLRYEKKGDS